MLVESAQNWTLEKSQGSHIALHITVTHLFGDFGFQEQVFLFCATDSLVCVYVCARMCECIVMW